MSEHWKRLLPVDRYQVHSNGILHNYNRKILTLLYQPLVGSLCYSLYMTLWSELEMDRLWGNEKTHHTLMSIMQMNLKGIFHERNKLEGIGLLKTYVYEQDDARLFIYELQPPLTPKQFFDDGILNVYLYNRIGKTQFNKLKHFFSDSQIDFENFTEVTQSFNDVYQSLHPSELKVNNSSEMSSALNPAKNHEYLSDVEPQGISMENHEEFDFDLLLAGISDAMIPKKAITTNVKEMIIKLAYVYRLSPIEMRDIVIRAVDPSTDQIDLEELRKLTRDWYQFEHGDALPALSERVQPKSERVMEHIEPKSKDEELMKQLELVSPHQLLKDISGGAEPSVTDMKMIEEVMFKQKLNPGVVNVLIYYVMLKSDMKLSKNYVTKIASHWARKEVNTVPEAMRLAKAEHRQYQGWAPSKNYKSKRKPIRQEMLPEWLKEKKENENPKKVEQKEESNQEVSDERAKFEELIQKFKE